MDDLDDRDIPATATVSESRYKGNRGGLRSGGGKRAGGGRGVTTGGRDIAISKTLSRLLRHQAANVGLELDSEGFARVDRVLQHGPLQSLSVTFTDIEKTVAACAKQRFTLKTDRTLDSPALAVAVPPDASRFLIRANQGHSIALASESLLSPITLEADNVPETVVHGTYFAYFPAIVRSGGLKPMGRNHVHFATGVPGEGGVVSGMRGNAELLIWADVKRSLEGGGAIKWWMSANGVVLTEGDENGLVPTKWWKRVEARSGNVGVLWEDGVKVKDLPTGIKGQKPPPVKGMQRMLSSQASRARGKGKNKEDARVSQAAKSRGAALDSDGQVREGERQVLAEK